MLIKQTWSLIRNNNCIGRINICLYYKLCETIIIIIIISNLSNDNSKASTKTIPRHSAI